MFVLDEADEMLSRGFKDQIYDIFQLLPPKLQVGTRHPTLHLFFEPVARSPAPRVLADGASPPPPHVIRPLPPTAPQVGVFSATLPPEALEITRKFMAKPVGAAAPGARTGGGEGGV